METNNNRVFYIDFIRAFACVCILIIHFNASVSGYDIWGTFYFPNAIVPNWYLKAYLGDIGVSLFFMVTGASLMVSNEQTSLRDYYRKRFFSIYPMFWIAFFVASLLSFLINRGFPMSKLYYILFSIFGFDGYLGSLGLIDGSFYQVGEWFLGCIIILYLIWPLLREGLKRFPLITWMLCLGSWFIFVRHVHPIWFFVRFPELLFGMTIVKYKQEQGNNRIFLLAGTAICAGIAYYLSIIEVINLFSWTVFFCAFLFAALLNISFLVKSQKIKDFVVAFSGLSYPLFLVHHWIIIRLARLFDLSNFPYRYTVCMFITYFFLSFLVASWLKKMGGRFTEKMKTICT